MYSAGVHGVGQRLYKESRRENGEVGKKWGKGGLKREGREEVEEGRKRERREEGEERMRRDGREEWMKREGREEGEEERKKKRKG